MKKPLTKIYYLPGLISALLVPVLFYFVFQPKLQQMEKNSRVMDIKLGFLEPKIRQPNDEFRDYIPTKDWTYQTVAVPPQDPMFRQKANAMVDELYRNNVEKTGIRFKLSAQNTYADFVALLDLFQAIDGLGTKHKKWFLTYSTDGKDFYVLNFQRVYNEEALLTNDTIDDGTMVFTPAESEYWRVHALGYYYEFIRYSPQASFYLFFGFLLFLYGIYFHRQGSKHHIKKLTF
jgi:hypothetical protein